MTTQRPTGVTILAVLQLIGGIISLFFGLSSLFFGGLMVASDAAATAGAEIDPGPILLLAGILAIISSVIGLIAGYGLFTLKGWGWTLAIVFAVLNILHNLLGRCQLNFRGRVCQHLLGPKHERQLQIPPLSD